MSSAEGQTPDEKTSAIKLKLKIKLTKAGGFVSVHDFDQSDTSSVAQRRSCEGSKQESCHSGQKHSASSLQYAAVQELLPCVSGIKKQNKKRKHKNRGKMDKGCPQTNFETALSGHGVICVGSSEHTHSDWQSNTKLMQPECADEVSGMNFNPWSSEASPEQDLTLPESLDDVTISVKPNFDLSTSSDGTDIVQVQILPGEHVETRKASVSGISSASCAENINNSSDMLHISHQHEDFGNVSDDTCDGSVPLDQVTILNSHSHFKQTERCSNIVKILTSDDKKDIIGIHFSQSQKDDPELSSYSEQFEKCLSVGQTPVQSGVKKNGHNLVCNADAESPDLFYVDSQLFSSAMYTDCSEALSSVCKSSVKDSAKQETASTYPAEKDSVADGSLRRTAVEGCDASETILNAEDGSDDDCLHALVIDAHGSEINNNLSDSHLEMASADGSQSCSSHLRHSDHETSQYDVGRKKSCHNEVDPGLQGMQNPYPEMLFTDDFADMITSARGKEALTSVVKNTALKACNYIETAKDLFKKDCSTSTIRSVTNFEFPLTTSCGAEQKYEDSGNLSLRHLLSLTSSDKQRALGGKIKTGRRVQSSSQLTISYSAVGSPHDGISAEAFNTEMCNVAPDSLSATKHVTSTGSACSASKTPSDRPGPMFSKRCRCKKPLPQEFPDYVQLNKSRQRNQMCGKCMKRISIPRTKKQNASCEGTNYSSRTQKPYYVYNEHSYSRSPHREPVSTSNMSVKELSRLCSSNVTNNEINRGETLIEGVAHTLSEPPGTVATCMFPEKHGADGTGTADKDSQYMTKQHFEEQSSSLSSSFAMQNSFRALPQVADSHMQTLSGSRGRFTKMKLKRLLKKEKKMKIRSMQVKHNLDNEIMMLNAFDFEPCFVVLERLPSQSCTADRPPCSRRCRAESLEFLCEFGKLRQCKHNVLKHTADAAGPKPKHLGNLNPKRNFFRHNKTLEGYEEYRQQQLQDIRLKRLKESGICDNRLLYDATASNMGVFFPLSLLCAEGKTNLHISDRDIKVEQSVSGERHLPSCSQPHSLPSDEKKSADTCASAESVMEHSPQMKVEKLRPKRHRQRSVMSHCRSSHKHSFSSVHLNEEQRNSHFDAQSKDTTDQCSDISTKDESMEKDQLKMSKFDVKYYVFEADGRAFVVPLIRSSSRMYSTNALDDEDMLYVKNVISLLLEEKSSCARHLGFPASLKHKQKSKGVPSSDTKDNEKSKPLFVGSAEEFHLECLKMFATDQHVLNMVPDNPKVSQAEYLQQIGDEVFLYVSGGMETAPPWIKELGKKMITKYRKRMWNRNRLKPSKDITIEIDYAVEDNNVDVGEDEDLLETSDSSLTASGPLNSCIMDSSAFTSSTAGESYGSASEYPAAAEPNADQQTGSCVSSDVFVQEKKPLLADLLGLTQVAGYANSTGETYLYGQHISIPLPVPPGFDGTQTQTDACSQLCHKLASSQHTAEYVTGSHETFEQEDRKPLAHELLAMTAVPVPPPETSGQECSMLFHAQEETGAHCCQQQDTDKQRSVVPFAVVKQEPLDDGYPCALSGGYAGECVQVKKETCDETLLQEEVFPFITAATFGPGVVELEQEISNDQRDNDSSTCFFPSQQMSVATHSFSQDPHLCHLSPWMVPDFDPQVAASSKHKAALEEKTQMKVENEQHLVVVPVPLPPQAGVDATDQYYNEGTQSENNTEHENDAKYAHNIKKQISVCGRSTTKALPVIAEVSSALMPQSEENCFNTREITHTSLVTDGIPVISEVCGANGMDQEREQQYEAEETSASFLPVIIGSSVTVWSDEEHANESSAQNATNASDEEASDNDGLPVIAEVTTTVWSDDQVDKDCVDHSTNCVFKTAESGDQPGMVGVARIFHSQENFDEIGFQHIAKTEPTTTYWPDITSGQHISIPFVLPPENNVCDKTNTVDVEPNHATGYIHISSSFSNAVVKQEPIEETAADYSFFPSAADRPATPNVDSHMWVVDQCRVYSDLAGADSAGAEIGMPLVAPHTMSSLTVPTNRPVVTSSVVSSPSSFATLPSSEVIPPVSHAAPGSKLKKKNRKKSKGWPGKANYTKQRKMTAADSQYSSFSGTVFPSSSTVDLGSIQETVGMLLASSSPSLPFQLDVPCDTADYFQALVQGTTGEEPMFDSSQETDDEIDLLPVFSALEESETCSPNNKLERLEKRLPRPENALSDSNDKHASSNEKLTDLNKKCDSPNKTQGSLDNELPSLVLNSRSDLQDLAVVPSTNQTEHNTETLETMLTSPEPLNPTGSSAVAALASQVAAIRSKKKRKPAKKGWSSTKKSTAKAKQKAVVSSAFMELPLEETCPRDRSSFSVHLRVSNPDTHTHNTESFEPKAVPSPPKRRKASRPLTSEKPHSIPTVSSVDRVTANLNSFLAKLRKRKEVEKKDFITESKTRPDSENAIRTKIPVSVFAENTRKAPTTGGKKITKVKQPDCHQSRAQDGTSDEAVGQQFGRLEDTPNKPRERSFFDCLPEDFLSAWKSS